MADRIVFALFLFFVVAAAADEDFSKKDYCKYQCRPGVYNVACNYKSTCPSKYSNYRTIENTDERIKAYLDTHNKIRRDTILGKTQIKGELSPEGSNMLKLKWNPELAYIATFTVRNCANKHDCRKTDTYNGQNIASGWSSVPLKDEDINKEIERLVKLWGSEDRDTPKQQLRNFTNSVVDGEVIGHFTQTVWADSPSVGCAMSLFNEETKGMTRYHRLVVCNYVYGNLLYTPVYQFGKPCAACPDHCEDSLCLERP